MGTHPCYFNILLQVICFSFIDDCNRMIHVYCMKFKDEVANIFNIFHKMIWDMYGFHSKRFLLENINVSSIGRLVGL